MSIKSYNFDVTSVLKPLGTPRGEVFLGTEVEYEVDRKLKKKNSREESSSAEDEDSIPEQELLDCPCENCLRILNKRRNQQPPAPPKVEEKPLISCFEDLIEEVEKSMKDFAILKSDGSINYGFEMVTAPASLLIQKARWKKFLEGPCKAFLQSASNCGQHIHVSKEPLSVEMRGNIHVFVNLPEHKRFIELIAGRSSNSYTKFIPKPKSAVENPVERYEAVNLLPKKTMEFRIFASTTDYAVLCKNLDFVAALVHWVQTNKIDNPTKMDFLAGVDRNRKNYPHLVEFLEVNKEL